jgi:hypothetical protein
MPQEQKCGKRRESKDVQQHRESNTTRLKQGHDGASREQTLKALTARGV